MNNIRRTLEFELKGQILRWFVIYAFKGTVGRDYDLLFSLIFNALKWITTTITENNDSLLNNMCKKRNTKGPAGWDFFPFSFADTYLMNEILDCNSLEKHHHFLYIFIFMTFTMCTMCILPKIPQVLRWPPFL